MNTECCKNCKYRAELIMWEEQNGRYLPNYNKPLVCCTALVFLEGGNTVYGHTDVTHNGMCELFVARGEK